MPNHWESSARPLFVKTVFVNGSRHAILFDKDPLLRCVNSPFKKFSRPNSSLSFTSDLSISSSDSQNTNSECNTSKFKNKPNQRKDLSSELQSCLIKFKLASDKLKNKNTSGEVKCFCNLKNEYMGKENPKQKGHKGNRDKSERFNEEQAEQKNSRDKSCYIYNLENCKGRRNYCFVKITSQPPQLILNCSCGSDWNESHNCNSSNKNNLVISASIQNLIMTPNENENQSETTLDYVIPSDFHWNNYLTRSYYNSFAERVFQWLDLARKRKQPVEKLDLIKVSNGETTNERIYSGKKFVKEIKKNEDLSKTSNKALSNKKIGRVFQSDTSEEEFEEKVVREQNVETLLSLEKMKNYTPESSEESKLLGKILNETDGVKPQKSEKSSASPNLNLSTNSPLTQTTSSSILNIIKTPYKIQDLLSNSSSKESNSFRNHSTKKIKEPRNASSRQNRHITETDRTEDERGSLTLYNKELNTRGVFVEKSDNRNKHLKCFCNGNLDKCADNKNNPILTEEFAEGNQKSINNLNNTRTRPVLIQNLSPQQHNKISSFEEEKIVWASEKNAVRPQLHIFMPTVLLKDQSDDSMSECENFLNL